MDTACRHSLSLSGHRRSERTKKRERENAWPHRNLMKFSNHLYCSPVRRRPHRGQWQPTAQIGNGKFSARQTNAMNLHRIVWSREFICIFSPFSVFFIIFILSVVVFISLFPHFESTFVWLFSPTKHNSVEIFFVWLFFYSWHFIVDAFLCRLFWLCFACISLVHLYGFHRWLRFLSAMVFIFPAMTTWVAFKVFTK